MYVGNRYIAPEKLAEACRKAAEELNVSVEVFERAVFEEKQEEYDIEDIKNWLDEEGYVYTDSDVGQILQFLRDDWDSDRGTWSNIESAYYSAGLDLSYKEDDEDD